MTNRRFKYLVYFVIGFVVLLIIYALVLFITATINNNKGDDISIPTAPPYDGQPTVSFDDKTDNQLLNTAGNGDYINIKYFIGEYLISKGLAKDPIPRVVVSNFVTDVVYMGTVGAYKNVYTFSAYSQDINTTLQIEVYDITNDDTTAIITIKNDGYSKVLDSYSYEKYNL
jgi:hypothetical protein